MHWSVYMIRNQGKQTKCFPTRFVCLQGWSYFENKKKNWSIFQPAECILICFVSNLCSCLKDKILKTLSKNGLTRALKSIYFVFEQVGHKSGNVGYMYSLLSGNVPVFWCKKNSLNGISFFNLWHENSKRTRFNVIPASVEFVNTY